MKETEAALTRVKSILASGTYEEASQEDKELIAFLADLKPPKEGVEQDEKIEKNAAAENDEKALLMQGYKS